MRTAAPKVEMADFRILYIDDDPDIREVVATALALDPECIVSVSDPGANALVAAADNRPDIILLDAVTPDVAEPPTLAHLRRHPLTAGIPIVLMTAWVRAHEIEQLKSLGAAGLISKPFDPMTLAAL